MQISIYNRKHWHALSHSLHFVGHEGRLATHPPFPASKSGSRLPVFDSVCLGLVPGQIDSQYLITMSRITIPRDEYYTILRQYEFWYIENGLLPFVPREYQSQGLDELLTRSCDNTNPLIKQLDAIDSVARMWLEMASQLDLNIFKGFKDEQSLVNFALNINNSKAGDTSKVVAG